MMFILLSEYTGSPEALNDLLDAHHEWAQRHYASGHFLVGGRRVPPVGGIGVLRADSREEVEQIAATDPWSIAGLIDYEILEFVESEQPNRHPAADVFLDSPMTTLY